MADIDQTIYTDVKERATELESMYSTRNTNLDTYKKMYLMNWEDAPSDTKIQKTISPDARNTIVGAKRILTSTAPQFTLRNDTGKAVDKKDAILAACNRMLEQSNKIRKRVLQYDLVESALLCGEVHIAISSTNAMFERISGDKKGLKARAEKAAALTPFLFDCWNPRNGYIEWDSLGMSAYYRKVKTRVSKLLADFGDDVVEFAENKKPSDEVELSIFYSDDQYAVWVEDTPIIAKENELGFIPIIGAVTDGSWLFEKPEENIQPFLYTLDKSGLWKSQNLALTVLYTNMLNIGINPIFKHTSKTGEPVQPDWSTPGGVIELGDGDTFDPIITKGILDPSFQQAFQIAEEKVTESTMYKQALGQPLSGDSTFSEISLLSQQGRLPLISTKTMCAEAIASTFELALSWMKTENIKCEGIELSASDVPDNLQLRVKLEVDLPQDKLQMANIAGMLTNQNNPITSNAWVRENILSIEQSTKMDEDILAEQYLRQVAQIFLQHKIAQQMQQAQAQAQQLQPLPQQSPMGAPSPIPTGQGFNPSAGGLPPQMAGNPEGGQIING